MKTLPKYFAIEFKESSLWEKYVKWINEKYDRDCGYWSDYWNEWEKLWFDEDWCDFYYEMSTFSDWTKLITLEEWDSIVNWTKQNKNLTYETQYLRSDWTLFTKDTIDWKSIEDLKQEMKEAMWTVNKIRGLLKAHKNKFTEKVFVTQDIWSPDWDKTVLWKKAKKWLTVMNII